MPRQALRVLRGLEEITAQVPDPASGRHVHLAVAAEGDPSVEPRVGVEGLGHQQVLHVAQRVTVQPAPRQGGRAAAVVVPLGVGEIDQPVVGEVRMERHVHQAAVAVVPHFRHAGNGARVELVIANQAQPAVALDNQHSAVRQERDAPGVRQPAGHDADADLVLLGGVDHPGAVAQRRHRHADGFFVLRVADRDQAEQQRRRQVNRTSDLHANLPHEPIPARSHIRCYAAESFRLPARGRWSCSTADRGRESGPFPARSPLSGRYSSGSSGSTPSGSCWSKAASTAASAAWAPINPTMSTRSCTPNACSARA